MKKIVLALLASAMFSNVHAAEMNFPSDDPIATISIPDSWKPNETETGIQATAADDSIYISIDVADAKTSDKIIDDAVKYLEDNGVKIDGSTQRQSEDKINGMDMTNFDWDGNDESGPASIGLSVLSPSPGKLLVITYWGTKGEQEKHGEELMGIINSLKPAG